MKKTFASAKNFVATHKTAVTIVAVVALTAASVAMTISNKREVAEFLAESEILEEIPVAA